MPKAVVLTGDDVSHTQLSHGQDGVLESGVFGHPTKSAIVFVTDQSGKDSVGTAGGGTAAAVAAAGGNAYVVDASLEEAMIQKRQELAEVGVEDLDKLAPPTHQVRGEYGNNNVAFEPDEVDMHIEESMTPRQMVVKAFATVFITLELEESSRFAKYLDLVTKAVIVLAIAAYLMSTEPDYQYRPASCDNPFCSDDVMLCPGYSICEGVEIPEITAVSDFTTYCFTVEYGLKFFTVWAVSSRVAGVVPAEWEEEYERNPNLAVPVYSPWYQTYKFFWRFKNLVDFASIFPAYVQYFAPSGGGSTNFVRVLRLLRLIRVLRLLRLLTFLKNVDVAMELIWATLGQSTLMLTVFFFFSMVLFVLFGCLIYITEQGTFTVNNLYPNGAFLKINDDMTGVKVSNIPSAVEGIYWAIGVGTGNGNIAATTDGGKALQCILSMLGILGLAFPVGVIGSELQRAYTKHFKRLKALSDAKEAERVAMAAAAAAAATAKQAERTLARSRSLFTRAQAQAEAEKWEARMYTRALKMQLAAQRFLRGVFPPFPPDTYLAVLQAEIEADVAARDAAFKTSLVGKLQRKYDRLQMIKARQKQENPGKGGRKRPPLSKANSSASNASGGGGKPGGGLSKDGSSTSLAGTGKAGSAADSVVTALTSRMESLTSMAAHDLDRSITKTGGNGSTNGSPGGDSKHG